MPEPRAARAQTASVSHSDALPGAGALPGQSRRELAAAAILALTDWLSVFACLAVVWAVRHLSAAWVPGVDPVTSLGFFLDHLYGLLPWVLAFAGARLYTRRALFWDEARRVVSACSIAALVAIAISYVGRDAGHLSRLVIGGTWATTLVVVPLVRARAKRWLTASRLWNRRVLIIGAGDNGRQVCVRLRANPELGYEPVAFVDDDPEKIGRALEALPVYGPLPLAPDLVRQTGAAEVVIAMPHLSRERLLRLIASCEGNVRSIRLVPDLFGVASVGVEAEDLDGVLLLHMRWNLSSPWNRLLKRLFDVVLAAAGALVFAPVLLAAAVAIRLDSPGPVLFSQVRLGRARRPFRCLKFRTMYVDADTHLDGLFERDPERSAEWERFAKLRGHDPRVTRVGRVLRRLSLDELPQLLNVLGGEMSLVGPRPYLPHEIDRMGDFADTILKASPGMSGLWQVSGRNRLPFEQRLRLDEYYVRNWALWTDVVVLLETVGAVWRGDGAY